MDSLLSPSPGLMIWTLVIFTIFFLLILKFGAKPIANALKAREDGINNAIKAAENANAQAQAHLVQSQEKLDQAQKEMAEIVAKGRQQAEAQIQKAAEESDKVKRQKVEEAKREIEISKNAALKELRTELAGLVIQATGKLLDEDLNDEKHQKLVDSYIEKLPQN